MYLVKHSVTLLAITGLLSLSSTAMAASNPIEALFSPLLDIGGKICNARQSNALLSTLNIASFCHTIQLAKRGFNIEQLLTNATQSLLKQTLSGVISKLGENANKHFLNDVDKWLGQFNEQAIQVLSMPQAIIDMIAVETQKSFFDSTQITVNAPDPGLKLTVTPYEGASREVQQDISSFNTTATSLSSGIKENIEAVGKIAADQQIQQKSNEVAQINQQNTEEALLNQQVSKQAKKAAEVATAGAQVTAPFDPKAGSGGIAEQYKWLAENAPSDRELLELNVKALADLMNQQATYMPAIADLLAEQSKVQAMTTEMLRSQTNQAMRQLTDAQDANVLTDQLAREIKSMQQESLNTMSPTLAALDAMICIYSGYTDSCKATETTNTNTNPMGE